MSTNKLFLTGDCHGEIDYHKLTTKGLAARNIDITENDFLLVCGDFGGVWDNSSNDKYVQDFYNSKPWTTLFVDGNHENHALLDSYPVSMWNGGKVHMISPSIIHLMRGQIYNICGKSIFTMGGAASHDRIYRKENVDWWAREMPSEEEYEEGFKNLEAHDNRVDLIVAHCAPDSVQDVIGHGYYEHDRLTNFLEVVNQTVEHKDFYCGHYHKDMNVGTRFHILYKDVVEI